MRIRVLSEQPVCAVRGCYQRSTEVDHIIPLQLGGAGLDRSNLQGMCKHHNSSKGARWQRPFVDDESVPDAVANFFGDGSPKRRWRL